MTEVVRRMLQHCARENKRINWAVFHDFLKKKKAFYLTAGRIKDLEVALFLDDYITSSCKVY